MKTYKQFIAEMDIGIGTYAAAQTAASIGIPAAAWTLNKAILAGQKAYKQFKDKSKPKDENS